MAQRLSDVKAFLFDLDGVVTRTARSHYLAWKTLFDAFLASVPAEGMASPDPFTLDDYNTFVDGRPRYDGVDAFLRARGMVLPWGSPTDAPWSAARPEATPATVCGLGNAKNLAFRDLVRRHGVEVIDGSVGFIQDVRRHGRRTAVVSSSRNCADILDAAGLRPLFDVMVDGGYAARHHLPGKPAPDTFVCAAHLLGVAPAECAVIEDALAGVEAGSAGAFGLVIGIGDADRRRALERGGADVVVQDLKELSLD